MRKISRRDWLLGGSTLLLAAQGRCWSEETFPPLKSEKPALHIVGLSEKQQPLDLIGEAVTEAQDGGLLARGRDNRLWTLTPKQITSRENVSEPFRLFTAEELKQELQREFPAPFRIVERGDYLFCTDTNTRFLDRGADLFVRLRKAFAAHWEKLKFPIMEPGQKLPVLIFAKQKDYRAYATREFGATIAQTTGYYSVMQNRVVLYDITAVTEETSPLERLADQVATIMHEACHQLAFNCGVQTRLADNPLWLTEGLAMYFETPDLTTRTGWRYAGALNSARLRDLRRDLDEHPETTLQTFLASDALFREPRREKGSYGRAWGLFYFLMKTKTAEMVKYLTAISQKSPLIWDTPEGRIAQFQEAFGDVDEVAKETGKYFERVGRKL
jgi:hypothetical protein